MCFCRGFEDTSLCFYGTCTTGEGRDEEDIDRQGLCRFFEEAAFEISCKRYMNRKKIESGVMMFRYFTDPAPSTGEVEALRAERMEEPSYKRVMTLEKSKSDVLNGVTATV